MNVSYGQVTLGPPSNLPWGDDLEPVIYLSRQEKSLAQKPTASKAQG